MKKRNLTDNKIFLTPSGYQDLLVEYNDLTKNKRPAIVNDITKARDMGDLSENGYYHAAKEKQSFIEGRIREIEEILKKVEVIENPIKGINIVSLGSKVVVEIQSKTVEFHIVGSNEVDSALNKISHESPIGSALMGKKEGEYIEITVPAGKIVYKIIEIK
jgi:transcription elongation factor GreA